MERPLTHATPPPIDRLVCDIYCYTYIIYNIYKQRNYCLCLYIYIYIYTHTYTALCEYKGAEGIYVLIIILYIMIITPQYSILYTASLILVAPPAALPLGATRLNLHSHQRNKEQSYFTLN